MSVLNEENFHELVRKALEKSGQDFEPSNLHDWQMSAIRSSLDNDTTLVSVPTGSGKTLVFQLLPLIASELRGCYCFVLIISPLIALITNQMRIFGEKKCVRLEKNTKFDRINSCIFNGDLTYVFCCPETFSTHEVQNWVMGWSIQRRLAVIAIDEAQQMCQCGEDFRPEYSELSKYISTSTKLLIMSGSLFMQIENSLINEKFTDRNPIVRIGSSVSMDRSNIFYITKECDDLSKVAKESLRWLISLMENYQDKVHDFPTTIIYVMTKKELDQLMRWLVSNAPATFKKRIVNYHAGIGDKDYRFRFLGEFLKDDSQFSIICTTSALGQGINKTTIRIVVCYGAPKSFGDLIQMSGRAGRDKLLALFLLLYSLKQLEQLECAALQVILLEGEDICKHDLILNQYRKLGNAVNKEAALDFCCDSCFRATPASLGVDPLEYAIERMLNIHIGATAPFLPLLAPSYSPTALPQTSSSVDLGLLPSEPATSSVAVAKEGIGRIDQNVLCRNINDFISSETPFLVRSSIIPTSISKRIIQGDPHFANNAGSLLLHETDFIKSNINKLFENSLRQMSDKVSQEEDELEGSPPASSDLQEAASKLAAENRAKVEKLMTKRKKIKESVTPSQKRNISSSTDQREVVDEPVGVDDLPPDWSNLTASQIYEYFYLSKKKADCKPGWMRRMNPSMGNFANPIIVSLIGRGIIPSGKMGLALNATEKSVQKPAFDQLDSPPRSEDLKFLRDLVTAEFSQVKFSSIENKEGQKEKK